MSLHESCTEPVFCVIPDENESSEEGTIGQTSTHIALNFSMPKCVYSKVLEGPKSERMPQIPPANVHRFALTV